MWFADAERLNISITVRVEDPKFMVIMYLIKLFRIGCLLVVLSVAEKYFLARYFDAMYMTADQDAPPNLLPAPLVVYGVESLVFLGVYTALVVWEVVAKEETNTFVIDTAFLVSLLADYVVTTCAAIIVSVGVAYAVMRCQLRYSTDGMRGIRATFRIMTYVAILVLLLPAYRFA
jgi:hypothetical protein